MNIFARLFENLLHKSNETIIEWYSHKDKPDSKVTILLIDALLALADD